MTRPALPLLSASVFVVATAGCGLDYSLQAVESLVVSAIDGAEDYLTSNPGALSTDAFRDCDTARTYVELFESADDDGDGELSESEADAAVGAYAIDEAQAALLGLVQLIYDLDDDGSFSQSELDALFDDFSARCESLQDELVVQGVGDGASQGGGDRYSSEGGRPPRQEEAGEMDECRRSCSGRDRGESAGMGPVVDEFDRDGDGELMDAELDEARSTIRARLRRGDNPHPGCGG